MATTTVETIEERIARVVAEWDPDDAPAVIAKKLRAEFEEDNLDALIDWLVEHADAILTDEIRRRLPKKRSGSSKGQRFQQALVLAETGDLDALGSFEHKHSVDGQEKAVKDLTGPDHELLAHRYQAQASTDVMLAAFHRAVAKRVGNKRTEDVLSEDVYRENLRSFASRMCGA